MAARLPGRTMILLDVVLALLVTAVTRKKTLGHPSTVSSHSLFAGSAPVVKAVPALLTRRVQRRPSAASASRNSASIVIVGAVPAATSTLTITVSNPVQSIAVAVGMLASVRVVLSAAMAPAMLRTSVH